jgi:integrase
MASIQVRQETGCLIIDFYYRGTRCREQTTLIDSPVSRKKVQRLIDRIESEISLGSFTYEQYFPNSKFLKKFAATPMAMSQKALAAAIAGQPYPGPNAGAANSPLFRDFAETWYSEKEIEWRKSHKTVVRSSLDRHLIPRFGEKVVGQITKADILAFRADLAKVQARKKKTMLSNQRINKILNPLRQILNEAADRFDFLTPYTNVKSLRIKKSDVHPFSFEEVKLIIDNVRKDFRNYFTTRFFTGMRTGEADGLKWKYIDFDRRLIMIRETIVNGEEGEAKTDGSIRDIQMSQVVYDALKAQESVTRHRSDFVFCQRNGKPLGNRNVTNRVWYPLLRYLNLAPRRPYQCRHTAATMWLAAGENPQWIAMQLGHTTTEMLFRVYSRFVPNLTRKDGSAFDRLLNGMMGSGDVPQQADVANDANGNDKEVGHG